MKKYFYSGLLGFLLFSCGKIGGNDAGTAIYGVLLHYVDSSGADLYATDCTSGFCWDSIQVYDITKGKKILPYCYENTYNFQIQNANVIRMNVCPNTDIVNRYSYTLIHLKNGIDDTLKCHIDENTISPSANIDQIWYNGVLKKFDSTGNITIVK